MEENCHIEPTAGRLNMTIYVLFRSYAGAGVPAVGRPTDGVPIKFC